MPLTGELEHLPIVDVIQLIHSTRKTGTLNVFSRIGEGCLVFNGGYIVGATHSNEQLRIGNILCECNIVSKEALDKALEIQETAGDDRKPLIATLLEHCGMDENTAFKALETLIEMTIVEMISWSKGYFSFDVDQIEICDKYRYLPTRLQELNLDTQMVLMDALRIFDEKVHAGEIQIVDEPMDELPAQLQQQDQQEDSGEELVVSEDILGLADLDKIERKKPHVFKSLEAFDPNEIHRQAINKTLPGLSDAEATKLTSFLAEGRPQTSQADAIKLTGPMQAVIFYSVDEFLLHAVLTVCKSDNLLVFTTTDYDRLDDLIARAQSRDMDPVLVFDAPSDNQEAFSQTALASSRAEKMDQYPNIPVIQLSYARDFAFTLQAHNSNVHSVLPKPNLMERRETFIEDMILFLETLNSRARGCYDRASEGYFDSMRKGLHELRNLQKAPEISLAVLEFIGTIFERSQTLIVDKGQLLTERSIGIVQDKEMGVAATRKFSFPLEEDSIFQQICSSNKPYFGPIRDKTLEQHLFPQIGAPLESTALLAPLKCNGRTITLTYADFGNSKSSKVPLDFIEFFIAQAGITMENALLRKQLAKSSRQP